MAFVIGDACVACGACEAQCPVGAISMGDGKFEIDADKCISCGSISPIRSRERSPNTVSRPIVAHDPV